MREKEILSRENPSVKRYVALAASRKERGKERFGVPKQQHGGRQQKKGGKYGVHSKNL